MAEGVGFEPTVGLLLLLISSQVPLTTQPPFQANEINAFLKPRTVCAAKLRAKKISDFFADSIRC